VPGDPAARAARRAGAIAGGYALRRASGAIPAATICVAGAPVVEALAAADELATGGVEVDVVCLTSPDLVFRALQARQGLGEGDDAILEALLPAARRGPLVTLLDGHPHTLAFLAGVHGTRIACLGVSDFGQSGDLGALYEHFGIDAGTVAGAVLDLVT
jgi:pyruvate dehydrogenase E1 component